MFFLIYELLYYYYFNILTSHSLILGLNTFVNTMSSLFSTNVSKFECTLILNYIFQKAWRLLLCAFVCTFN